MKKLSFFLIAAMLSYSSVASTVVKISNADKNTAFKSQASITKDTVIKEPASAIYIEDVEGQSLSELRKKDITSNINNTGEAPEGDAGQFAAFTADGSHVAFCNRMSDNVTIHSIPDGNLVQTLQFDAGTFPTQIAINDEYAVVTLLYGAKAVVYDVSNWTEVQSFDTGLHPFAVKIKAGKAYIPCEGEDILEIIDLSTMTKTSINEVPWGISAQSGTYSFNRTCYSGSDFVVTDDGNTVATYEPGSYSSEGHIAIVDVESGTVTKFEGGKFHKCTTLGLSGDNTKLIATTSPLDGAYFLRFNLETKELEKEIFKSGDYIFGAPECAVNSNGDRVLAAGSNNDWYIDFSAETAVPVGYSNPASHIYESSDNTKAFVQSFSTFVVDLETGGVLDEFFQYGMGASRFAVSPQEDYVVTFDGMADEYARVIKYDNYQGNFEGAFNIGQVPEGDAPRDIVITPNGEKAVVSNGISCSATIINLNTKEVEAVLPCGETVGWSKYAQNLAVTSDSRYAVVTTYTNKSLAVIDLETNTIVKNVDLNIDHVAQVAISPDDQYAYVGSAGENIIAKVKLDGENSSLESTFSGPIVSGTYGGDFAPMKVTPDGNTLMVADGQGLSLNLYDTTDGSLITAVPIGESIINGAFSDDCTKAIMCKGNSITILELDGANSTVGMTTTIGGDYASIGLPAYNPVKNSFLFYVSEYGASKYVHMSAESGEILGEYLLGADDSPYKSAIDKDGNLIFHYIVNGDFQEFKIKIVNPDTNDETITDAPIPYWGAAYNATKNVYAGVIPGPDVAGFVFLESTDINENFIVPVKSDLISAYPNPFNPETKINYTVPEGYNGIVNIAVYNSKGEMVKTLVNQNMNSGQYSVNFTAKGLTSGVYYYGIKAGNYQQMKKITLIK